MHELGVLYQALKTVDGIAKKNHISKIKHITLDVGKDSDFVPAYLEKLYPAAIDSFSIMQGSQLRISIVEGTGLSIREIGY